MKLNLLSDAPSAALALALADFERKFSYPLGADIDFHISHGEDYPLFFRAMGSAVCAVAQDDRGMVCGTLGAVLRDLQLPGGAVRRAVYLADLKILPGARRGRVLLALNQAIQSWALAGGADCSYGVVMHGTERLPSRYSGRLGIHAFKPVAELALFRVAGSPGPAQPEYESGQLDACFRSLSSDRFAPLGGTPALRSHRPPVALMSPESDACGVLEDTRRAKRLWLADGTEIRSSHLSSFAYRTPAAAIRLIREALVRCAPDALFFSVPLAEKEIFSRAFGFAIPAAATVFAAALDVPAADWNIATSEI